MYSALHKAATCKIKIKTKWKLKSCTKLEYVCSIKLSHGPLVVLRNEVCKNGDVILIQMCNKNSFAQRIRCQVKYTVFGATAEMLEYDFYHLHFVVKKF